MTEAPPFRMGQVELPDAVYRELIPLDGRPRDDQPGARLYVYRKRWWVAVFHTGFGEAVVGYWGPLSRESAPEVDLTDEAGRPAP